MTRQTPDSVKNEPLMSKRAREPSNLDDWLDRNAQEAARETENSMRFVGYVLLVVTFALFVTLFLGLGYLKLPL